MSRLHNSLLSWWKMNDNAASTLVLDAQGNGNGTFVDAVGNPNTNTHDVAGLINGALTFDGLDDYISTPTTPPTIGTISIRFKLLSINLIEHRYLVASHHAVNQDRCYIAITSATLLGGGIGSDSLGTIKGTTTLVVGPWYQATLKWNGSKVCLFLNNVKEYEGAQPAAIPSLTFAIGARHTELALADFFADVEIDSVMIFDTPLTKSEIFYIYNNGKSSENLAEIDSNSRSRTLRRN